MTKNGGIVIQYKLIDIRNKFIIIFFLKTFD